MADFAPVPAQNARAPVHLAGMSVGGQLILLQISCWISVAALLINATAAHQTAVLASALISLVLLWNELRVTAVGQAALGRLLLHFGIFYWFWLGAVYAAFSDPAFPNPDIGYRYFFGSASPSVVGTSILCVNLFSFCAIAGWRFAPVPRRLLLRVADRNDPQPAGLTDALCLVLAVLAWIPLVVAHSGSLSAVVADLMSMRSGEVVREDVGIISHLYLLGVAGGALAIARLALALPGNWLTRIAAAVTMLPLVFLMEGSRFNMGFLVMPAILLLLVPVGDPAVFRQRRTRAALLGAAGLVLVLVQGAVRSEGLLETEQRQEETSFLQTVERGFFGHDHFGAQLIAIDVVQTREDFFYEPMLPFFFTHWVPRSVWPEKPDMVSWVTYNDEVTQGRAFNVTPSVTGQYYMNWWYFGVVEIGLILGWLARLAEFWINSVNLRTQMVSAIIAALLLSFVFLSFRMLHPLYFSYPLFAFIIFLVACRRARRQHVTFGLPGVTAAERTPTVEQAGSFGGAVVSAPPAE